MCSMHSQVPITVNKLIGVMKSISGYTTTEVLQVRMRKKLMVLTKLILLYKLV